METYTDFSGFVLYPEGTRNIKPKALPLRRGMLKYTWRGVGAFLLAFFLSFISSTFVCARLKEAGLTEGGT